jgi:hypothetical protein
LYKEHIEELRTALSKAKEMGKSSLVLKQFWMYPDLWSELGESRKNIFFEGLKNGVFLEKLYRDKWFTNALVTVSEIDQKELFLRFLHDYFPIIEEDDENLFNIFLKHAAMKGNIELIEVIFKQERLAIERNIGISEEELRKANELDELSVITSSNGSIRLIDKSDEVSGLVRHVDFLRSDKISEENWNVILDGGTRGNQMSTVEMAIKHGAVQWDYALYEAVRGGHIDIAKFFLRKIEDQYKIFPRSDDPIEINTDDLMGEAGESGNIEMVKWVIHIIVNMGKQPNFYRACNLSLISGNIETIMFLFERLPEFNIYLLDTDNEEVIQFIASIKHKLDNKSLAISMAETGNRKWVSYFLSKAKKDPNTLFSIVLNATRGGHIDLAIDIFNMLGPKYICDTELLLRNAVENDADKLIGFFSEIIKFKSEASDLRRMGTEITYFDRTKLHEKILMR